MSLEESMDLGLHISRRKCDLILNPYQPFLPPLLVMENAVGISYLLKFLLTIYAFHSFIMWFNKTWGRTIFRGVLYEAQRLSSLFIITQPVSLILKPKALCFLAFGESCQSTSHGVLFLR